MLSNGVNTCIFFGIYGNSLRYLESRGELKQHHLSCVFLAGCIGGAAQVTVTAPNDLVKTQLQVQTGRDTGSVRAIQYRGPVHCMRSIYRHEGFRGCYRGVVALMWRDIPSFGVYMVIYEAIAGGENKDSAVRVIIGGGVTGVVTWALVLPIDVVKSRIQADCTVNPRYRGLVDCIRQSYREEGSTVFVRGFWTLVTRAFYVNAVTFVAYSYTLRVLQGSRQ